MRRFISVIIIALTVISQHSDCLAGSIGNIQPNTTYKLQYPYRFSLSARTYRQDESSLDTHWVANLFWLHSLIKSTVLDSPATIVSYSTGKKFIAVLTKNNSCVLYNLMSNQEMTFPVQKKPVKSMDFIEDKALCIRYHDNQMDIVCREDFTIDLHTAQIRNASFVKNSIILIYTDNVVQVADAETQTTKIIQACPHKKIACSGLTPDKHFLYVGYIDNTIGRFNLKRKSNPPERMIRLIKKPIARTAFINNRLMCITYKDGFRDYINIKSAKKVLDNVNRNVKVVIPEGDNKIIAIFDRFHKLDIRRQHDGRHISHIPLRENLTAVALKTITIGKKKILAVIYNNNTIDLINPKNGKRISARQLLSPFCHIDHTVMIGSEKREDCIRVLYPDNSAEIFKLSTGESLFVIQSSPSKILKVGFINNRNIGNANYDLPPFSFARYTDRLELFSGLGMKRTIMVKHKPIISLFIREKEIRTPYLEHSPSNRICFLLIRYTDGQVDIFDITDGRRPIVTIQTQKERLMYNPVICNLHPLAKKKPYIAIEYSKYPNFAESLFDFFDLQSGKKIRTITSKRKRISSTGYSKNKFTIQYSDREKQTCKIRRKFLIKLCDHADQGNISPLFPDENLPYNENPFNDEDPFKVETPLEEPTPKSPSSAQSITNPIMSLAKNTQANITGRKRKRSQLYDKKQYDVGIPPRKRRKLSHPKPEGTFAKTPKLDLD